METCANWMALAKPGCVFCDGLGVVEIYAGRRLHDARVGKKIWRKGKAGQLRPCNCVWRGAFRACLLRYRACLSDPDRYATREVTHDGTTVCGFRRAEYVADFEICGARALAAAEPAFLAIFRLHYVAGAEWEQCTRMLPIDKGTFYHFAYRVEEILGRAFVELQPYGLFPRDYFAGRWVPGTRGAAKSDNGIGRLGHIFSEEVRALAA